MNKESKKFPAVMTTQNVLGIEEGTVLKFDWASGKYVSISEEEDIAEDYFYSGYALALDPYLVKDNIGTYFTFIEQEDSKEEVLEEGKPLPEEEIKIEATPAPEYTKTHVLVLDCECGYRKLIGTIQAPGIQFIIMAEDENSFMEFVCPECDSKFKLWFAPSNEDIGDEPTKEESN